MKLAHVAGALVVPAFLAGCAFEAADVVDFAARATAYGATIDGDITREEAPAYIRAAVDIGADRIPAQYVGYVLVACNLVDDGIVVVDLPAEGVALCEQLQATIPAPA